MASVRRIAELVGVSPATVSKVINGRSGVNVKTIARVRKVMDKFDFMPQSKAVDMNRILVITPKFSRLISSVYTTSILAGLCEMASQVEMSISIKHIDNSQCSAGELRHMLRQEGASGAVLIAFRDGHGIADTFGIERCVHAVVGLSIHEHDVNQVVLDDYASAIRATQYLQDLGHNAISIVTSTRQEVGHAQRYAGFCYAMEKTQLDPMLKQGVACLGSMPQNGAEAFDELWSNPQKPTAVVVTNETIALGFAQRALEKGVKIPEDLSIISYESNGILEFTNPSFTTLLTPTFEMGQQAMRMIQMQLQTQTHSNSRWHPMTTMLQHTLIPRKTTCSPRNSS